MKRNAFFCLPFLSFILIIFYSTNSIAQTEQNEEEENGIEELIQEFPFSTTVYLQDRNEIQQTFIAGHAEEESIGNTLGYELEYGITDRFQISAGYTYEHWKTEDVSYNAGWFEAGAILGILNTTEQALALSFEAEFPGDKPDMEIEEAEFEAAYSPMLIYARAFDRVQLHLNAGAEFQDDSTEWIYNAAAVYGTGAIHPLLEINAVSEDEFKWFVGTGLVFNNDKGWELVTGVRHGVDNKNWNAILNLIYEFSPGESEEE